MQAAPFDPPPADSRDLPLYAVEGTPRRAAAFGAAVPPRELYSRKLPGVYFGEEDVLVLENTPFAASAQSWQRNTVTWAPRGARRVAKAAQCIVPAPLFVAMFSVPFWCALAVFCIGLIPLA